MSEVAIKFFETLIMFYGGWFIGGAIIEPNPDNNTGLFLGVVWSAGLVILMELI